MMFFIVLKSDRARRGVEDLGEGIVTEPFLIHFLLLEILVESLLGSVHGPITRRCRCYSQNRPIQREIHFY